jgi:phage shock protein A
MQEILEEKRLREKELRRKLQLLHKQRPLLSKEESSQQERVLLCLEQANEPLAKSAIRKRLELQRLLRSLEAQIEQQEEALRALGDEIQLEQSLLEETLEQLEMLKQQELESQPVLALPQSGSFISNDEIEVAFLEEKTKWSNKQQGVVS